MFGVFELDTCLPLKENGRYFRPSRTMAVFIPAVIVGLFVDLDYSRGCMPA